MRDGTRWVPAIAAVPMACVRSVNMMKMSVVNLKDATERLSEHWSPSSRANSSGTSMMAKTSFFVVKGSLVIQYEYCTVALKEGDFHIVPKGVKYNPLAEEECWIALIEPVSTKHTGDVVSKQMKAIEGQLGPAHA